MNASLTGSRAASKQASKEGRAKLQQRLLNEWPPYYSTIHKARYLTRNPLETRLDIWLVPIMILCVFRTFQFAVATRRRSSVLVFVLVPRAFIFFGITVE